MTWAQLETAFVNWVKASTGLAGAAVRLSDQNAPSAFPGPSAVVKVGDSHSLGVDEVTHDYDAGRPLGQEIVFSTKGIREVTVSVSFFTPTTTGNATARAMATQAQDALSLPSQRAALNQAGIGILDLGDVRWVPVVDSGVWYGQAVLELRCVLRQTATEATGYIQTVESTTTIT